MINPLSNYLSQCWPCSVTMYGANRTQSIKTAYWWKTGAIYIKTDNAHFLIFMWDQYILFCIAWNRRKLKSRASSRRSNPSSRRLKKNGEGGTVQPVSVLTMKYNPFSYFVSTLVSIMTWHRKDDSDLETSSLSKNCEIIQVLAYYNDSNIFSAYVTPNASLPHNIEKLTGITYDEDSQLMHHNGHYVVPRTIETVNMNMIGWVNKF